MGGQVNSTIVERKEGWPAYPSRSFWFLARVKIWGARKSKEIIADGVFTATVFVFNAHLLGWNNIAQSGPFDRAGTARTSGPGSSSALPQPSFSTSSAGIRCKRSWIGMRYVPLPGVRQLLLPVSSKAS
jgi:hypothetical protein